MYKFAIIGSLFSLLLPQLAYAASYNQPSELLRAIEYNGTPREFSAEMQLQVEDTFAATWINGQVGDQGNGSIGAVMGAAMDIHDAGQTTRTRFEIRLYNNIAYIRITEIINLSGPEMSHTVMHDLLGHWIEIPIDSLAANSPIVSALLANEYTGIAELTPEDMDLLGRNAIDTLMNMKRLTFEGGEAYVLTLKESIVNDLAGVFSMVAIQPTIIEAPQQSMQDAIAFEYKVDTDTNGAFRYARLQFGIKEEGFMMSLKGETQRKTTSPSVTPPIATLSYSAVQSLLAPYDIGNLDTLFFPSMNEEEIEIEWIDEQPQYPRRSWRPDERQQIRKSVQQQLPTTVQQTKTPRCDALPGTALYNQYVRKGICQDLSAGRPGRGTLRSFR